MSYYEESMSGLDQIFDALMQNQSRQPDIMVDEMQMNDDQIAQSLMEKMGQGGVGGVGQQPSWSLNQNAQAPWEMPDWMSGED